MYNDQGISLGLLLTFTFFWLWAGCLSILWCNFKWTMILRISEEHTCASYIQTAAQVECTRGCSTKENLLFSSSEEQFCLKVKVVILSQSQELEVSQDTFCLFYRPGILLENAFLLGVFVILWSQLVISARIVRHCCIFSVSWDCLDYQCFTSILTKPPNLWKLTVMH